MSAISLRVHLSEKNVTKTMLFHPRASVADACRIIREKNTEANVGLPTDYGLFLADVENKRGVWLEPGRSLEHYILRNTDLLEYKYKMRSLKVRLLDGSLKTLLVDDSQPVANLMVVICAKIGITNHDEYSLIKDGLEEEQEKKERKDSKMELLKKKLKTDDELNWLDPSKTLREQGINEVETVLLRRKFFFSDQNIDSRDPVQLSLLYAQTRNAILDETHPVTEKKACEFAGIQCQIQFGDYNETKHRPRFLPLNDFLPKAFGKVKNIEKKIYTEYMKHQGKSELDAKVLYTKTARELPTYGVAFYLVKEKGKGKNKLVPRLLGVTKDVVLRLDEKTKEILKTWPLTTVRRWGGSPTTFTLDFGDYSDEYYSVQTTEAEQIQQLIAGYIDIILRRKQSKDHLGIEGDEGSTLMEDSVYQSRAAVLQHEPKIVPKISVAKPAVIHAADDGSRTFKKGIMSVEKLSTTGGQVHVAHTHPPSVQQSKICSLQGEPQRALLSTVSVGHEIIVTAEEELVTLVTILSEGTDPAKQQWKRASFNTNKQNVIDNIAAVNAATAQVVALMSAK